MTLSLTVQHQEIAFIKPTHLPSIIYLIEIAWQFNNYQSWLVSC